MKTISAVIITINNKDVVNAIDSVRSSCSEIIVVDTGSDQEHLGFLKTTWNQIISFQMVR